MKLKIETWNDNVGMLSDDGKNLLQEAIICYKNSAYRSAYIMSYLAFMITVKDRVLAYNVCPEGINANVWSEIRNDLADENGWEECVLNLLSKQSFEVEYLRCGGKSSVDKLREDLNGTGQDTLKRNLDACLQNYLGDSGELGKVQDYTLVFKGIKVNGKEKLDSKKRRKANIFKCTDVDFLSQLSYYRTMRNQCAHFKGSAIEFGACNVECFWIFMKNYLPKLQIGGALDYWKEKILYCYRFYKDEEELLEETFLSLKACSFSDVELMEIWKNLLENMNIDYNVWDNKVSCDFEFLKYICSFEWSRNSFIGFLKNDFCMRENVSVTYLGLLYSEMKNELKPYLSSELEFWKGCLYDKVLSLLRKSKFFDSYLFDVWFDLIKDLASNNEKKTTLLKSMTLRHINNMIEYHQYTDKLREVQYFEEVSKEISTYLPCSITYTNYSGFANRWLGMVEINLWAIENIISKGVKEDTQVQTTQDELWLFLVEIKRVFENEPDFYIQQQIAGRIISEIERGEYPIIKEKWELLSQETSQQD